jgi:hypothetical protein
VKTRGYDLFDRFIRLVILVLKARADTQWHICGLKCKSGIRDAALSRGISIPESRHFPVFQSYTTYSEINRISNYDLIIAMVPIHPNVRSNGIKQNCETLKDHVADSIGVSENSSLQKTEELKGKRSLQKMIAGFQKSSNLSFLSVTSSFGCRLSQHKILPLSRHRFHWAELPNRFNERNVCRICRNLADIEFDGP